MATDLTTRRKYPRIRVPKRTWVGWKATGYHSTTSRAKSMGLGGLYLFAANPPGEGSAIELIFELPTGTFRARAVVSRSTPGEGMGVKFIQMSVQDRARLNRYLSSAQEDPAAALTDSRPENSHCANSQLAISLPGEEAAQLRFESEIARLIEVTGKGTYYQILGVTSESPRSQIKKSYYSLVRKCHPDNHMGNRELITRYAAVMAVITEAYKTIENEEARAAYDKRLAGRAAFTLRRAKTEIGESLEEWLRRGKECLRAQNFVGSIVWLRKCVEAAPEQALYHAMLARSLGTVTLYRNEAVAQFQEAIDLDPWSEPVYVQFAELLEKMQLPRRAATVYSKLREITPTHSRACERLAALQTKENDKKPSLWASQLFSRKS